MKIFRALDALSIPGTTFAGTVHGGKLAGDDAPGAAIHLYDVRFDDRARTDWHAHSGPQWLFVTAGRIRVQEWGGAAAELSAGDAVLIPPGSKHWHGSAPGARGSHLAVNVNSTTTWLEPVSDQQYAG